MAATTEETAALLARVPVFAALDPEHLSDVAAVAVPRGFEKGTVVFREGDESDTCYVVRTGHARAIRDHPDGRTITLATFGPGNFFGELAMFDSERRSATVEAVDDLETVGILGADMRRLLRDHPEISAELVVALGRRLREANERLARQSFQTVQSRVAGVLGELVQQAQAEDGRGHQQPEHHVGRQLRVQLFVQVGAVVRRAGAQADRHERQPDDNNDERGKSKSKPLLHRTNTGFDCVSLTVLPNTRRML